MNAQTIKKLQKDNGFYEIQQQINEGIVWELEGSICRYASDLLSSGVCMLPTKSYRDYYGNYVPSRKDLIRGTKGTYGNSVRYWSSYLKYRNKTLLLHIKLKLKKMKNLTIKNFPLETAKDIRFQLSSIDVYRIDKNLFELNDTSCGWVSVTIDKKTLKKLINKQISILELNWN